MFAISGFTGTSSAWAGVIRLKPKNTDISSAKDFLKNDKVKLLEDYWAIYSR